MEEPPWIQLRRELRMVRRLLGGCAVIVVALAVAVILLATRKPHELAIGKVTIDGEGISIRDPEHNTGAKLTAAYIGVSDDRTGGAGLFPGEAVVNDVDHTQSVRISAFSDSRGGSANIALDSIRSEHESHILGTQLSGIHLSTSRTSALMFVTDPTSSRDLMELVRENKPTD